MVGALVTGANGYVGGAVASALRRLGHEVFGLVRSVEQQGPLLAAEITPVIGTMENVDEWGTEDLFSRVDVVVDTATSRQTTFSGSQKIIERLRAKGEKEKKLTKYFYTSGCLVFGDQRGEILSENSERKPPPFVVWRMEVEDQVLSLSSQGDGVSTTVVRPGFVYGSHGGHYAVKWFQQGEDDKIVVKGNPKKRYSWVHVDDLAAAFVLLSQRNANEIRGQVFNVGDDTQVPFDEVVIAMGRVAGGKGEVTYEDPIVNDPFHSFVDLDCLLSSQKIKGFGWTASHAFLPDLPKYYLSWKASQKAAAAAH